MKIKVAILFIFVLISLFISVVCFAFVGCTPGLSFSCVSFSFFLMGVSYSLLMFFCFFLFRFLRNPSGFIPDEYIKQNMEVTKND